MTFSTPAVAAVLVTAVVAGLARGFSGFGAALIFMPVASAVLGPRTAAPVLLLVDGVAALGLLPAGWRGANRREVATMVAGAVFGIPAGAWALSRLDPLLVRWCLTALVLFMLVLLVSGWRYRDRLPAPAVAATGLFGGIVSGATQMSGPLLMAVWLGGEATRTTVRANSVLFFAAGTVIAVVSYVGAALVTGPVLVLSALTLPGYAVGLWAGARLFTRASEQAFRRVCYALIATAAVISLPLLDHLLR